MTKIRSMETGDAKKWDVVIVGGGPGGIAAAIWCDELGLRTRLFEMHQRTGGQLFSINLPIVNYPGTFAENGSELAERFARSLERSGASSSAGVEVAKIEADNLRVTTSGGEVIEPSAIVIATGVSRRRAGVPGEERFRGKGVLDSASREPTRAKGKRVVIIGGGDAAFENALIVAEYASSVTIMHRRNEFSARREFIDQARSNPKIEVKTGYVLTAVEGDDVVRNVKVTNAGGDVEELAADLVLIRIGVRPNSELVAGQVACDDAGYITTDSERCTSAKGIYAVGDVASPIAPTIASAVGHGASAAKHILHSLFTKR